MSIKLPWLDISAFIGTREDPPQAPPITCGVDWASGPDTTVVSTVSVDGEIYEVLPGFVVSPSLLRTLCRAVDGRRLSVRSTADPDLYIPPGVAK